MQLVSMVIGSGKAIFLRSSTASSLTSTSKDLAVAEFTAVALSDDQVSRLKAALTNSSGHEVNIKVVIDPTVIGRVVATVDSVIDGSGRTRLDRLKALWRTRHG